MIDISAYLQRIGFDGPLHADLETLRALHRAHVLAIPCENFDVQLKRPITIDPHAAFEKLVHRRRGGWKARPMLPMSAFRRTGRALSTR